MKTMLRLPPSIIVLALLAALALCVSTVEGCTTPAPPQPPVQTVLVPQTIVVTPASKEPRAAETRAAETRASESMPPNAPSSTSAPTATATLTPTSTPPRTSQTGKSCPGSGLTVYDAKNLFSEFGNIMEMPDQQTPILLQPDGSYSLFVTGVSISEPHHAEVDLFGATDLTDPKTYRSLGTVLKSSCLCEHTPGPISNVCGPLKLGDERAEYFGMLSVFPIKKNDFQDLMGFYIADQTIFADDTTCPTKKGDFYSQVGFTISHDGGRTWDRQGPVLANEPLPNRPDSPEGGPIDFNQPTFFKTDKYIYAFLDSYPSGQWPKDKPIRRSQRSLQVARAPIKADGLPGQWSKYYHGTFDSGQPGMYGLGDDIMPSSTDDLKLASMAWVSYNTYLNKYLMTFVAQNGWYYSTLPEQDLDKQDWSTPIKFYTVPGEGNWIKGQPTEENMVFMTPGLESNHTTAQDGLVVYSTMPEWAAAIGKRAFAVAKYCFGP